MGSVPVLVPRGVDSTVVWALGLEQTKVSVEVPVQALGLGPVA